MSSQPASATDLDKVLMNQNESKITHHCTMHGCMVFECIPVIKEGVVNVKNKQLLSLSPWVHFFHLWEYIFGTAFETGDLVCHYLILSHPLLNFLQVQLSVLNCHLNIKSSNLNQKLRVCDLFLLLEVIEHLWQILGDSLCLSYGLFQTGKS